MNILIIRAGALGDTLMLMPLINGLSGHRIITAGRKPGIDYLGPYADQIIDIDRGGWHGLFSPGSNIDINCPRVDHVTAFINDRDNIVSENLKGLFPFSKINIFPPFPGPGSKTHVALHMLQSLHSSGIPVDPSAAFNASINQPAMGSKRVKGKKIILHPGSGSKKKNYQPDFWFDLSARLKKEKPDPSADVCFLLGPAEEDLIPLVKEKAAELNTEVVVPYKEELLSILNNTFIYIGHDSGVTHLAAMLGVNTLALFKNSSVDQWHPLGPCVTVIQHEKNENKLLEIVLSEVIRVLKF